MVLLGLLLVALVCLVLGLVLASGPWLIGSLVASGVAAFILWRQRGRMDTAPDRPQGAAPPRRTALVTGTAFEGRTTEASGAGDQPQVADPQVWVVDGSPDFHTQACVRLEGRDAEPIPLSQAREDGFLECAGCAPTRQAADPSRDDRVWVVDGRPRYHLESCLILKDQDAEPIPLAQATEDGFMPCSLCEPDNARVARP